MDNDIQSKILHEYINTGDSLNKIATRYNVDFKTAKRLLLKNDIEFTPRRNITKLNENLILKLYLTEKLGVVDISKRLKTSHKKVSDVLKKHNISPKNRCLYEINEDFFKMIDNQYKAYLLGFITADGYVTKSDNNYRMGITINKKDIEILEYFKEFTQSNSPIVSLDRNLIRISIHNQNFIKHLLTKGVVPNKTFNTLPILMNIPNKFKNHFIRGYFDGDGTVFRSSRNTKLVRCGFIGNIEFISELQKILKMGRINKRSYTTVVDLNIKTQSDIQIFFNYLYSNSNIHLKRKYNKFVE